ncbi:hypothetical protein ACFPK1_28225 [Actinomycetospora rhizophila]|uniref:Uncharacterized protein n=1 Tax=Actinomycetospora rhizophila TaxID=1416876 RepID=A0ABV9ZLI0_9PSEU
MAGVESSEPGITMTVGVHVRPDARMGFTVHAGEDRVTLDVEERTGSRLTLFLHSGELVRLSECFAAAVAELLAAQHAVRGACGSV